MHSVLCRLNNISVFVTGLCSLHVVFRHVQTVILGNVTHSLNAFFTSFQMKIPTIYFTDTLLNFGTNRMLMTGKFSLLGNNRRLWKRLLANMQRQGMRGVGIVVQ